MLAAPRYVRRYETLKLDDEDKAPLRESDSYVKVGDPVRELIEPQAEEAPD